MRSKTFEDSSKLTEATQVIHRKWTDAHKDPTNAYKANEFQACEDLNELRNYDKELSEACKTIGK